MSKGATNKRYTPEFKRDAVALLRSSGRPITHVAKELGITDTSLGQWAREDAKTIQTDGWGEAEVEEARLLRKRIKGLEEEIAILKRFTVYWVKEQGR